jgi:type I restriction enzyme R subunit
MSVFDNLLPEQLARIKIDKQLVEAGWDIVTREEYVPFHAQAVKEALMAGTTESDYLLFVDNKAIAVVEAKREESNLGDVVAEQAENYSRTPKKWYGLWFDGMIPLVYLANGKKIYFKNMLDPDSEYVELSKMHSPKKMLNLIGAQSNLGALPRIDRGGLRDCQYRAETEFENSLRSGKKKALAVLATGSGKTYLACLAAYRLLNYTPVDRVLFLVDRNNLAKQTKNEFSTFDKTENGMTLNTLYRINRLAKQDDINGDVVISTIQKLFAVLTGNNLIDDGDGDESEDYFKDEPENEPEVELGNDL